MTNGFKKRLGRDISALENAEQSALICAEEQIAVVPFVPAQVLGNSVPTGDECYDPNWVYDQCIKHNCRISFTYTGLNSGLTAVTAFPDYFPVSGLDYLMVNKAIRPCATHVLSCSLQSPTGEYELHSHILFFRTGPEKYDEKALKNIPGVKINTSGRAFPITAGVVQDPLCGGSVWEYSYEFGHSALPGNIDLMPKELLQAYGKEPGLLKVSPETPQRGGRVQKRLLEPITEGDRNNELTRRAGVLFGVKQLSLHEGLNSLMAINQECCQPPLPDAEVETIAKSIHRRASFNA